MSVPGRGFEVDDVVVLGEHEDRHRTLRVDPAQLVALVSVPVAVEGPPVPGAHQLARVDVAVGEIVVEMRAPTRRAAHTPVGAAPHDELLAGELDGAHAARRDRARGDAHRQLAVTSSG